MTKGQDLKKLNRSDLLELLLEERRENDRLRTVLKKACKELADKKLQIEKSGTLAEAALKLNGIFEAADAAAAQYLENIRRKGGKAEVPAKADADDGSAQKKADEIIAAAEAYSEKTRAEADAYSKKVRSDADRAKAQVVAEIQSMLKDRDAIRALLNSRGKNKS